MAITPEGKAIGRNPFRLFTYLRSPIEWYTNERNRSGAPKNVPSSDGLRPPSLAILWCYEMLWNAIIWLVRSIDRWKRVICRRCALRRPSVAFSSNTSLILWNDIIWLVRSIYLLVAGEGSILFGKNVDVDLSLDVKKIHGKFRCICTYGF
jgi:hypothetical protein